MKALFEIVLRSPEPVKSLLTPTSNAAVGTLVNTRGQAFMESPAGTAAPADGTMPISGFITRNSQVGGPVLGDVIYPGRLELPFPSGDPGSFEDGIEIEAEGATFIDAGITGSTALKTPLSFLAGKFAVGASGQFVEYMLVEQQTPTVATNVRIRARRIPGYLKP